MSTFTENNPTFNVDRGRGWECMYWSKREWDFVVNLDCNCNLFSKLVADIIACLLGKTHNNQIYYNLEMCVNCENCESSCLYVCVSKWLCFRVCVFLCIRMCNCVFVKVFDYMGIHLDLKKL